MSLINEALRKARQAAAEHDDQRNLGRVPQAYPGRNRRRGVGPAAIALVAFLAGIVGAAAVWWIVGAGAPDTPLPQAATLQAPPETGPEKAAGDPPAAPASAPEASAEPAEQPVRVVTSAPPPPVVTGPGDSETGLSDPPPATPAATATPGTTASNEREFVMDADLGYATLSLGYIVFRPVRPFAEINGNDVYEGSEVAGFTVDAIEIDRVVLSDSRGPLVLRVP